MNSLLQQPFFQVTLPIMLTLVVTVWLASWAQNKRLDDIVRRLDNIEARLLAIEARFADFGERLTRVEERTSPIGRH
jgi:cytochrome oxidase assembly protein ShyY1